MSPVSRITMAVGFRKTEERLVATQSGSELVGFLMILRIRVAQWVLCYKRASGPWFRGTSGLARLFHFWVLRIVVSAELLYWICRSQSKRLRNTSGFEGAED